MIAIDLRKFVQEYWAAISGKAKTLPLLDKYIRDSELKNHILSYEVPFPCYELFADDFICEDDKIVVRARFKGTHKGDMMGIAPTGKTVEVPFSVIYQVDGEKIIKSWLFMNQMELMNQLGIASDN
ncbi:MAG: ester cyclase [Bacteroidia bacterium]|nr:ester cyclase [Bacteroidia bacterium]